MIPFALIGLNVLGGGTYFFLVVLRLLILASVGTLSVALGGRLFQFLGEGYGPISLALSIACGLICFASMLKGVVAEILGSRDKQFKETKRAR